MNCTSSTITTTHQSTREVVKTHIVNKPIEVEHVNIQKHVVNTNVIQQE